MMHPCGRQRVAAIFRRSPWLAVLLASGVIAGTLWGLGFLVWAWWIAAGTAALIGLVEVVGLVREARRGRWGLDILAVAAITATLWLGDALAAYIISGMIVGGEAIEAAAAARARRTLTALLNRAPRLGHLITPDGHRDVPVDEIRVGDELLVRIGEPVPVDGTSLEELIEVDAASLTGESVPVSVHQGEVVPSGSIALGRAARIRATATAGDSQYQRIIALVEGAASTKGRFIRLADRVAVPFTVIAFGIAGLAWLISGDPVRFAQVLVVATPCPLLVAAPTALVAGMDRAARLGIVVKGGDALERLARVSAAAFDKTGTLTGGQPQVARIEAVEGSEWDAATMLSIVAAVETRSVHVFAEALVAGAQERGVPVAAVEDVHEEVGHGLRASWRGAPVVVGKPAFVATHASGSTGGDELGPGEAAVDIAIGGTVAGRIVLRDDIRPEAAVAITALRELGVGRVVMVTGDGDANARRVAHDAGIDEVHADLRPEQKVAVLAEMPHSMMIGDGVNDAPVLAAADVGVAMGGRGASAASETADVVLLSDDLHLIPESVRVARRTIRIARQSVGVGVGLSLVLMGIAATGVIPAVGGALAQEAIDVLTIVNGLRAARGPFAGAGRSVYGVGASTGARSARPTRDPAEDL